MTTNWQLLGPEVVSWSVCLSGYTAEVTVSAALLFAPQSLIRGGFCLLILSLKILVASPN